MGPVVVTPLAEFLTIAILFSMIIACMVIPILIFTPRVRKPKKVKNDRNRH
jgi:hypothetical protein